MAVTLCGASSYSRKYYLNPQFDRLPDHVKNELQIMCVTFTEEVGGILTVEFGEDRLPRFVVRAAENDGNFDGDRADMEIQKLRQSKSDLMQKLSLFYRIFVLGEAPGSLPDGE